LTLFLGTYEYAMDARGRVPVPPGYREFFADGAVISQGAPSRCLRLFTLAGFEIEATHYMTRPSTKKAGRIARDGIFARSYPVNLDGQGRILIPATLREYAGLEGNIVVVGAGEWLAIWSPELHQTHMATVDELLEETLETLEPEA
jgi:MraZ protein